MLILQLRGLRTECLAIRGLVPAEAFLSSKILGLVLRACHGLQCSSGTMRQLHIWPYRGVAVIITARHRTYWEAEEWDLCLVYKRDAPWCNMSLYHFLASDVKGGSSSWYTGSFLRVSRSSPLLYWLIKVFSLQVFTFNTEEIERDG